MEKFVAKNARPHLVTMTKTLNFSSKKEKKTVAEARFERRAFRSTDHHSTDWAIASCWQEGCRLAFFNATKNWAVATRGADCRRQLNFQFADRCPIFPSFIMHQLRHHNFVNKKINENRHILVKNHETPLCSTACLGLIWPFTILRGETESSHSLLSKVLSWLTA